jgi:FkbM family methyltransferase
MLSEKLRNRGLCLYCEQELIQQDIASVSRHQHGGLQMQLSDLGNVIHPVIARKNFQSFWHFLHKLSLHGMGHCVYEAKINGEFKFLDKWAGYCAEQRIQPVIVDAGANEGDFVHRFRSLCPGATVHCFEPNPLTYDRLRQRFRDDPGVLVHRLGLGEEPKKATLFAPRTVSMSGLASLVPEAMGSFLPKDPTEDDKSLEAYDVDIMRLDDYAEARNIPKIDYLKMDVEGYEKYVLAGASRLIQRGAIDIIHLEMNHHNAIVGMSLFHLHRALMDFDIYKVLVDGMYPLVTSANMYNAWEESYHLHNLICVRRASPVASLFA